MLHNQRGFPLILPMHTWIIARPGRVRMLDRLNIHRRTVPHVRFRRAVDVAQDFAIANRPSQMD